MHQNLQGIYSSSKTVCFGLSVSLSLHFWGLYRCDSGGIFTNACDTVPKILRLKFVDRLKTKAY